MTLPLLELQEATGGLSTHHLVPRGTQCQAEGHKRHLIRLSKAAPKLSIGGLWELQSLGPHVFQRYSPTSSYECKYACTDTDAHIYTTHDYTKIHITHIHKYMIYTYRWHTREYIQTTNKYIYKIYKGLYTHT